jgi:2-polyprenyl-3-methyl-5-hydroxy-6-metoxy-1,4-benzoquinol methylase
MELVDKAGRSHWDEEWEGRQLPVPFDPEDRRLRLHGLRAFHLQLARALAGRRTEGRSLLEIGCARSRWLPYFAKEYGFEVAGLDYSAPGCAQARGVLQAAGLDGDIVCADMFDPPQRMMGAYDVVVSFGVIEHFSPTEDCLRACAAFLRPGGLLVTEIPNMKGLVGWCTRTLSRSLYDIHVPMSAGELAAAHTHAGLAVLWSDYVLSFDWSVLPLSELRPTWLQPIAKTAAQGAAALAWSLDRASLPLPPSGATSPYIFCVATKPAGQG